MTQRMIADARQRLEKVPFAPLLITSNGPEYSVPAVDQAFVRPLGNRVVVIADDSATNIPGQLHINTVVDALDGE